MITAFIYRYPHPTILGRFIYVGQESKEGQRDKEHRAGRTPFGKRFKRRFPNTLLPHPVRRKIEGQNYFDINEEEIIDMFQFHTWRSYSDGLNITLPGDFSYREMGRIGGIIRGPQAVKTGQLRAITSSGGKISGLIQVRKHLGMFAPEYLGKGGRTAAGGKRNAELGNMKILGLSGLGLHTRWHVSRNQFNSNCKLCLAEQGDLK